MRTLAPSMTVYVVDMCPSPTVQSVQHSLQWPDCPSQCSHSAPLVLPSPQIQTGLRGCCKAPAHSVTHQSSEQQRGGDRGHTLPREEPPSSLREPSLSLVSSAGNVRGQASSPRGLKDFFPMTEGSHQSHFERCWSHSPSPVGNTDFPSVSTDKNALVSLGAGVL